MAHNLLPVKEVARRKKCFITTPSDAARRGNLDGVIVNGRVVGIVNNAKLRRWRPSAVAQRVRAGKKGASLRKDAARRRFRDNNVIVQPIDEQSSAAAVRAMVEDLTSQSGRGGDKFCAHCGGKLKST